MTILGLTPNDLGGMAGYEAVSPGAPTKFSGFDAYQLAGTAPVQNRPTFLAVKSVMIPGKDGASYLFQLNAVSKPEQQEIVGAAMGHIDTETTIN